MKTIELAIPVGKTLSVKDVESLASRQNGGAECVVTKRSLDARGGIVYRYQIEVYASGEHPEPYEVPEYRDVRDSEPVIVVGAGPAGMFTALRLLSLGLKPIILERGKDVHARKTDMAKLSREGVIDPDSNYCYGEGGAGAFSDGKLFTRSSKRGDIRLVLHQLVRFGASPDILIDAHPHIGSDKLPLIVENIRKCIIEHGGEYHFNSRVVDISLFGFAGDFDLVFTHAKDGESYSISRLELRDAVGGFDSVEGLSLAKEFLRGQEEALYPNGMRAEVRRAR